MTLLNEFDYIYPPQLVAQVPSIQRGGSRLMVCHRKTQEILHTTFSSIIDYLEPNDCLVLNDTRVIPARLLGKKETGGAVEILLLHSVGSHQWRCLGKCLAKGIRRDQKGCKVIFTEDFEGVLREQADDVWLIEFQGNNSLNDYLKHHGHVPLPPYIERRDEALDRERYQTVFSKNDGAAAAPTAGLHWTQDLIKKAKQKGIDIAFVTLHVGSGTFLPIRTENIEDHKMHSEYVEISEETLQKINNAKRVVAVGTTVVRALESAEGSHCFWTDLFIRPGHEFKIVDALQTNFHQPKSSLLVMVSSFAGRDFVMKCYQEAIEKKYQLFSYGDTMLFL